MKIDKSTYKLDDSNYISQGTEKNKIIIGSTYSVDMNHFTGWTKRFNGSYKKTAMFTISIDGNIYEHFNPNYFSELMDTSDLNETSITILLENEGWLIKDLSNENKYINYIGHIYNRKDSVIEKPWRNQIYWAPFSTEQVNSAIKLVTNLCEEYDIPLNVVTHNTTFDGADKFNGILYRSNFEKYYTDISPAWDFKYFKDKIEKKQTK